MISSKEHNMTKGINILEKLQLFTEQWQPKVITEMNDYQLKIAKIKGEFEWHSHSETDEVFFVIEGKLIIHLRDDSIELNPMELYVVPKGVEHKPYAEEEAKIMLIEPRGTASTGDNVGKRAAQEDEWI